MAFHMRVLNGKVGDQVVVSLSGPSLPGEINQQLPQSLTIDKQFPVPKDPGSAVSASVQRPT